MAMTLVETVTVGSGGAASIEFTNIPQTGKDILLLVSGRATDSGTTFANYVQFNSDTGSNYSLRILEGTGSTVSSSSLFGNNRNYAGWSPGSTATANTFGNNELYISNYTSSTAKSSSLNGVGENNATATRHGISAQNWTGTAAISSLAIYTFGTNFAQHSTASLYIIS